MTYIQISSKTKHVKELTQAIHTCFCYAKLDEKTLKSILLNFSECFYLANSLAMKKSYGSEPFEINITTTKEYPKAISESTVCMVYDLLLKRTLDQLYELLE